MINLRLTGAIQRYPWGSVGHNSLVGRLSGFAERESQTTFAELWFGDHPLGATQVVKNGIPSTTLEHEIQSSPETLLGVEVASCFGGRLPFLMKVLSIRDPLSIQLHPDSKNARELRAAKPEIYPDDRHKPELAIAISEVELVIGLKPYAEITDLISSSSILKDFFSGVAPISSQNEIINLLERIFSSAAKERTELVTRLVSSLFAGTRTVSEKIFLRAAQHFATDDPGLLFLLLMNHVTLMPGEGIFIPPGVPHAYLSGDLVECMAASDNVVRCGLTPKKIDVHSFLRLVELGPSKHQLYSAPPESRQHQMYLPPVEDFQVMQLCSDSQGSFVEVPRSKSGPAIVVCIEGVTELSTDGITAEDVLKTGDARYLFEDQQKLFVRTTNSLIFIGRCNLT